MRKEDDPFYKWRESEYNIRDTTLPAPSIDNTGATEMSELYEEMAMKFGISKRDMIVIMGKYYREVVRAMTEWKHPRIRIEGIGTMSFKPWKVHKHYRRGNPGAHHTPYQKIYEQYDRDQVQRELTWERRRKGEVSPTTERLRKKGDNKRKR